MTVHLGGLLMGLLPEQGYSCLPPGQAGPVLWARLAFFSGASGRSWSTTPRNTP